MKLNYLLILMGLCCLSPRTIQAQNPRLRVLTYNIRWGERADIEKLSQVIMATDPDLVSFQEVDVCVKRTGTNASNQQHCIAQFAENTGMYTVYGATFKIKKYPFGFGGGEFGNAILSRFPFDYTRKHIYEAKGTEYRVALEAGITLPTGENIRFVATHLDHNNNPVRLQQIAQINSLFTGDTVPTILAGDLNERPDDVNGSIAALDRYWDRQCDDEFTFIAWEPTVKIDYVFTRPHGRWRVVSSEVIAEGDASDHRPVLVVLELVR